MLVRPGLPDQPDPNQIGTTFLTPLLSTSLPDTTYHIQSESFGRDKGGWGYFHVKDEEKNTLYTLTGFKLHGFQLPRVMFTRASEYTKDIIAIDITPINTQEVFKSVAKGFGRTLTVVCASTETKTQVVPDRLETVDGWTPRRFIWGQKRFVWKVPKNAPFEERLYEVKKEWPDPASRTGKIADEVHERPLVVVKKPMFGSSNVCTITIVGGLDQTFREYILSTYLARAMVEKLGHGNIY
jgi:hypothetical protein